jgi:hypothetical protein
MLFNYIEIIWIENTPPSLVGDDFKEIDMRLTENRFGNLFASAKNKYHKYTERYVKQYVKNELFYEVTLDKETFKYDDIKIYSKVIHECEQKDQVLYCKCQKQKYQFHSFPSSSDIHSVQYIRRQTFRCNNRIFLNFDTVKPLDASETFLKCFINVNQDSSSDTDYLDAELNALMRHLAQAY